jgi:hypothetical protein
MAVTKPVAYLNWTDGSPSKITQPPSPQLLSGWTASERAPFQYMNWLFWDIDQWIQWLDQITTPANLQQTITANTTGAFYVRTYLCNTAGGAFNFTFPPAATAGKGVQFYLKNITFGGANNVSLVPTGSDDLEGTNASTPLTPGQNQLWESDGVSNWYLMAGG